MFFRQTINDLYNGYRVKYSVPENNIAFSCHVPLSIENKVHAFPFDFWYHRKRNGNKKLVLSLGFFVGQQRIYLSDQQIIHTILKMDESDINWFFEKLLLLSKGEGESLIIKVDDKVYPYRGFPIYPKKKVVHLFTDSIIGIDYFSALLSFIFFSNSQRANNGHPVDIDEKRLNKYIDIISFFS